MACKSCGRGRDLFLFSPKGCLEGPFALKLLTVDCGLNTMALCHVSVLILGSKRRGHGSPVKSPH